MRLLFALHRPDGALADILMVLILIVALTFAFWRRHR
ncbi:hypothetical protein [Paraburkholderia sp. BL17N1]|nr:hypothetical protein [Paraburkholderia sp. BL17N1]